MKAKKKASTAAAAVASPPAPDVVSPKRKRYVFTTFYIYFEYINNKIITLLEYYINYLSKGMRLQKLQKKIPKKLRATGKSIKSIFIFF